MAKPESQREKSSASKKIGVTEVYLIFYNLVSVIGWLGILLLTHKSLITYRTQSDLLESKNLYNSVSYWLRLFQTLALLEVLHASLKLVKSNPILNFVQIASRLLVVWVIMGGFEPSKKCLGVLLVSLAWSVTEVIRYSYYALNIVGFVPYILTWCRYSFFIILYPLGVLGELICIFYAIHNAYTSAKVRNQYSYRLPNSLNFSYDVLYVLIACVIAYIPGFPPLYKHMLAQRRKVLAAEKPKQN